MKRFIQLILITCLALAVGCSTPQNGSKSKDTREVKTVLIKDFNGSIEVPTTFSDTDSLFSWLISEGDVQVFAQLMTTSEHSRADCGWVIMARMPMSGVEAWSVYLFSKNGKDKEWKFAGYQVGAIVIPNGARFSTAYVSSNVLLLGNNVDGITDALAIDSKGLHRIKVPAEAREKIKFNFRPASPKAK